MRAPPDSWLITLSIGRSPFYFNDNNALGATITIHWQRQMKTVEMIEMMDNAINHDLTSRAMSLDHLDMLADALGGVPCWGVLTDSPSAEAGLRYGDIVLEINGVPTPDYQAYFAARSLDKEKCVFKIWRDGQEVSGVMQLCS